MPCSWLSAKTLAFFFFYNYFFHIHKNLLSPHSCFKMIIGLPLPAAPHYFFLCPSLTLLIPPLSFTGNPKCVCVGGGELKPMLVSSGNNYLFLFTDWKSLVLAQWVMWEHGGKSKFCFRHPHLGFRTNESSHETEAIESLHLACWLHLWFSVYTPIRSKQHFPPFTSPERRSSDSCYSAAFVCIIAWQGWSSYTGLKAFF